jgi:hypothetical protein
MASRPIASAPIASAPAAVAASAKAPNLTMTFDLMASSRAGSVPAHGRGDIRNAWEGFGLTIPLA